MDSVTTEIQKNSNFYNLEDMSISVIDNIESILEHFGITEYNRYTNRISCPCPVHEGDRDEGFSILTEGVGNWRCFTHFCHHDYTGSIIGLIRALLSKKEQKEVSFKDAIKWIAEYLNIERSQPDHKNDTLLSYYTHKRVEKRDSIIPKESILNLEIPSPYFLKRGFSKEILQKYNVGLCMERNKQMYKRSVVPIYDENYKYIVGCTGRSIYEECKKCKQFHHLKQQCPNKPNIYCKWKNSKGFLRDNHLYNYWFAKPFIEKSMTAIIVEGQGDVWSLEEAGIHVGLGIMGDSITSKQFELLNKTGIINLVFALDNDKAGTKSRERLYNLFCGLYNIKFLDIPKKDFGEMNRKEIKDFIRTSIKELR